jgi:Cof subfamily protein (haloacid dehalogenase superfamily)
MTLRMAFADMDDTFLTRDKRVTGTNLMALTHLAERGAEFVPCSGRPATMIPPEVVSSPATHYAVSSNGAAVSRVHPDGTIEVLHRRCMDIADVMDIYEKVADRHITFDVFIDGVALAERSRYDWLSDFVKEPAIQAVIRAMRKVVDAPMSQIVAGHDYAEKVTVFWGDPADRDLVTSLVDANPRLAWTSSMPQNIEFSVVGATKGAGLTWLAGNLGVDVADVVSFGDNLNDISMIEAAGTGVAMGNAMPEVKAAADDVTLDCDESGVGVYIERLLARQDASVGA